MESKLLKDKQVNTGERLVLWGMEQGGKKDSVELETSHILLPFTQDNSPRQKKHGGTEILQQFLNCFSNLDSGLKATPTHKKPTTIKIKIKLPASRSVQEHQLLLTYLLTKIKYSYIHKTLKFFCVSMQQ